MWYTMTSSWTPGAFNLKINKIRNYNFKNVPRKRVIETPQIPIT
jgi:hypothetical protein